MPRFIIASNNPHKIKEIERILNPLGIEAVSACDAGFNLDDVEETGATFAENAFLKAKAAFEKTGLPAVADDSGLEVYALNRRPGVYTARYGGSGLSTRDRYILLLDEMQGIPEENRGARFVSSICCFIKRDLIVTSEGVCEGRIAFEARGSDGFGYDPIFLIPQKGKTFAELSDSEKDSFSHRGRALCELRDKLKKIKEI